MGPELIPRGESDNRPAMNDTGMRSQAIRASATRDRISCTMYVLEADRQSQDGRPRQAVRLRARSIGPQNKVQMLVNVELE